MMGDFMFVLVFMFPIWFSIFYYIFVYMILKMDNVSIYFFFTMLFIFTHLFFSYFGKNFLDLWVGIEIMMFLGLIVSYLCSKGGGFPASRGTDSYR